MLFILNSVSLSTGILPVSYKYSVEASTHKWWMVEMSGATPVIFPQLGLEADWWEYNKHHCRENKYLVNLQMDIPYLDFYIFKGLTLEYRLDGVIPDVVFTLQPHCSCSYLPLICLSTNQNIQLMSSLHWPIYNKLYPAAITQFNWVNCWKDNILQQKCVIFGVFDIFAMKILRMQLLPHVLPALVRGLSSSVGSLILAQER